jgi:hypothetical protein
MSGDARTRYLSLFVRMASVHGAEVERWSDADIAAAYIALRTNTFEEWQAVIASGADAAQMLPDQLTPEMEAANAEAVAALGLKSAKQEAA